MATIRQRNVASTKTPSLSSETRTETHIRKSKSGLEWPRKLFHSATGFIAIALWVLGMPIRPVLQFLTLGAVVILVADIWRFNSKSFEILYEKQLGALMRTSEKNKINGVVWYLLSAIFCLSVYPRDIAVMSIIILSWCDTAASIFGRLFGRYTPKLPFSGTLFAERKSLAGSMAAFAAGSFIGFLFFNFLAPIGGRGDLSWVGDNLKLNQLWTGKPIFKPTRLPQFPNPQSSASLPFLCSVTGLSAALAEAIEIWGLDDNLTMAPLAGLIIWVSMYLN